MTEHTMVVQNGQETKQDVAGKIGGRALNAFIKTSKTVLTNQFFEDSDKRIQKALIRGDRVAGTLRQNKGREYAKQNDGQSRKQNCPKAACNMFFLLGGNGCLFACRFGSVTKRLHLLRRDGIESAQLSTSVAHKNISSFYFYG